MRMAPSERAKIWLSGLALGFIIWVILGAPGL